MWRRSNYIIGAGMSMEADDVEKEDDMRMGRRRKRRRKSRKILRKQQ